jgi:hypothetical protein
MEDLAATLLQRVNREAAQQLGVEVGGLLRQDFAGEGDVTDLADAAGIHEECDVGAARADGGQSFRGVADVGKVSLFADGFFRQADDAFQQNFV